MVPNRELYDTARSESILGIVIRSSSCKNSPNMPVLTRCNEWSEGALLNRQEGILPLEIADFVVNVDDK